VSGEATRLADSPPAMYSYWISILEKFHGAASDTDDDKNVIHIYYLLFVCLRRRGRQETHRARSSRKTRFGTGVLTLVCKSRAVMHVITFVIETSVLFATRLLCCYCASPRSSRTIVMVAGFNRAAAIISLFDGNFQSGAPLADDPRARR
jgi:hypothetical protein